ncbi:protein kinase domain-containing protein [Spirillospora sp. CA-253888]
MAGRGFTEVRELGAGAQGRVVLARHEGSGTPVAIKYLTRRGADDPAALRFRQEAVLLGRIRDPHVARLYRLVETGDGAAIVMEAVDGVALKRVPAEHGALAPEAALLVLKGSLLGLAEARADNGPTGDVLAADAEVTLHTPRLLSLSYSYAFEVDRSRPENQGKVISGGVSALVDLTTGRGLGVREVFRPEILTPAGLRRLGAAIEAEDKRGCLADHPIRLADAVPADPAKTTLSWTFYPRHVTIGVELPDASMSCAAAAMTVPYEKAAALLRPDPVAEARTARPTVSPRPTA